MARDLDRFHRDPAQLRHPRPPGTAEHPTFLPASVEQRLDELLHRVAALEHALGHGAPTVAAEALDPLRTLLEVLTGEVARLRRAPGPDVVVADPPAGDPPAGEALAGEAPAGEASVLPPFPPLASPASPVAPPALAPGSGIPSEPAPPPDRPAVHPDPASSPAGWTRPEPPPGPAERSALIPIAVMAIPILLLATVFLDRVPTQAPVAIQRPMPSHPAPRPKAIAAPSPRPVAPPSAAVRPAAVMADRHPPAPAPPPHPLVAPAGPLVPTPTVVAPPAHPPAPTVAAGTQPGVVTVIGPDTAGSAAGTPPAPATAPPPAAEASAIRPLPIHPAAPPELATASPIPAPRPAPGAIQPAAAPPPAKPSAKPSAPGAPPKPGLAIRTTADAWVSVIDAKGMPVFSRLMHAGDSWTPPRPGLLMTTGNAGGTELVVNGIPGPPLGAPGAVLHGVPLAVPLGAAHAPKPSHAP